MSRNYNFSELNSNRDKMPIIAKLIIAGIIVLLLIICGFRCFYSVNEQHNAVVTQFGTVLKVDTAGFYFKAPWQSVKKVDMTTHGTPIGYSIQDGQNIPNTDDGIMITEDYNFLNIDFYMEYAVSDPIAYLYNTKNPELVLRSIAQANIRTVVSNYTVDEAMTTAKGQIQADIKQAIIDELDKNNIGLKIINITIQDSEPPKDEIKAAFQSVENAKQNADTAMNKAKEYQNSQLPAAQAKADNIVKQAEADKAARIAEAKGQVERFNKMYEEYKQFPLVTKTRLFYEKMEKVLPGCKIIITDGKTSTVYPLDSFTKSNTKPPYATPNTTTANTTTTDGGNG